MNYVIEIKDFEGPLDLLLHLIKESKVDIFDVSINDVTKQYMNYLKLMEQLNLNIASEYLVMAAELIEIKSYILLPKKKILEEDEFEEDPRENLIKKLLEYEKYKEVTQKLKNLEKERNQIFTKKATDLNIYDNKTKDLTENFNINDLMSAFNKMIERKELDKPLETKITNKEYSIKERCNQIKFILKEKKKVEFTSLFDVYSKEYIIVTFLSILNLAKLNEISIIQDINFSKIYLESLGD
ncbi:MAG: segregation/condensation protein A [Bacilli bacterium]